MFFVGIIAVRLFFVKTKRNFFFFTIHAIIHVRGKHRVPNSKPSVQKPIWNHFFFPQLTNNLLSPFIVVFWWLDLTTKKNSKNSNRSLFRQLLEKKSTKGKKLNRIMILWNWLLFVKKKKKHLTFMRHHYSLRDVFTVCHESKWYDSTYF